MAEDLPDMLGQSIVAFLAQAVAHNLQKLEKRVILAK